MEFYERAKNKLKNTWNSLKKIIYGVEKCGLNSRLCISSLSS